MTKKHAIVSPKEAAQHRDAGKLDGKNNWWNRHRFDLISNFLPRTSMSQSLLDFGCGNGLFLIYLQNSKYNLSLTGYEPFLTNNVFEHSGGGTVGIHDSLEKLDNKSFDIVITLDVLEHIEKDKKALVQINKLLKFQGYLLLTVPAYHCLYSLHDAAVGHYRRYNKPTIVNLLEKHGFSVLHATYFFCFLVPPSAIRKLFLSVRSMWQNSHVLDAPTDPLKLFSLLTYMEIKLLQKTNFYLPFGTSIFVLARKIRHWS